MSLCERFCFPCFTCGRFSRFHFYDWETLSCWSRTTLLTRLSFSPSSSHQSRSVRKPGRKIFLRFYNKLTHFLGWDDLEAEQVFHHFCTLPTFCLFFSLNVSPRRSCLGPEGPLVLSSQKVRVSLFFLPFSAFDLSQFLRYG